MLVSLVFFYFSPVLFPIRESDKKIDFNLCCYVFCPLILHLIRFIYSLLFSLQFVFPWNLDFIVFVVYVFLLLCLKIQRMGNRTKNSIALVSTTQLAMMAFEFTRFFLLHARYLAYTHARISFICGCMCVACVMLVFVSNLVSASNLPLDIVVVLFIAIACVCVCLYVKQNAWDRKEEQREGERVERSYVYNCTKCHVIVPPW